MALNLLQTAPLSVLTKILPWIVYTHQLYSLTSLSERWIWSQPAPFPTFWLLKRWRFHLVLSYLKLLTAGITADLLFSLGTHPSPSITSLPFGFLPTFLITTPQSSSWPTWPLLIFPGRVCLDSPTSFVLSLFTTPGEVTFSQDGLHKFWGLVQNENVGSFSKQWLSFQDGTSRVWVSSMGLWQLYKLHVHEASTVFNSRTSSAQCLPGFYFQPRPLSWALGLNTILYDNHSLFDHQYPPSRFWFTPDSFTHQLWGKTHTLPELQCLSVKSASLCGSWCKYQGGESITDVDNIPYQQL